jgi:hypothetical protein
MILDLNLILVLAKLHYLLFELWSHEVLVLLIGEEIEVVTRVLIKLLELFIHQINVLFQSSNDVDFLDVRVLLFHLIGN